MILTILKCEMCDEQHAIRPVQTPTEGMPPEWLTLYRGDHIGQEGWHFCSERCLAHWATGTIAETMKATEDLAPQSKTRRFLLIDGETADEIEGVKWSDGHVVLNDQQVVGASRYIFHGWGDLQATHIGSGVQWIDQEVKDATNSN